MTARDELLEAAGFLETHGVLPDFLGTPAVRAVVDPLLPGNKVDIVVALQAAAAGDVEKPPARPCPTVGGEPAADRLMRMLDYRYTPEVEPPGRCQVAAVLHALADHTALEAARTYRRPTDHAADFHPTSTAIGRWLHDVADQLEADRG